MALKTYAVLMYVTIDPCSHEDRPDHWDWAEGVLRPSLNERLRVVFCQEVEADPCPTA